MPDLDKLEAEGNIGGLAQALAHQRLDLHKEMLKAGERAAIYEGAVHQLDAGIDPDTVLRSLNYPWYIGYNACDPLLRSKLVHTAGFHSGKADAYADALRSLEGI